MSLPPVTQVAVLDSSVLVPLWSRVLLQQLAARPDPPFVPAWSEWIIAETWRVLTWRWLIRGGRNDETEWRSLTRAANRMLRRLLPVITLVSLRDYAGPEPWSGLRDEDDTPIWQTAVVARAQYVVSHNLTDFPPLVEGRHVYGGIEDVLGEDAAVIYGAPCHKGHPSAVVVCHDRIALALLPGGVRVCLVTYSES